jgi:hypothetical protein
MTCHEREITLCCVQILNTIEALRNKFASSGTSNDAELQSQPHSHLLPIGLHHLSDVTTKVLTILMDLHSLPEEKVVFFATHEPDISAGLAMMLDILEKCRDEVPNYFGVFEVGDGDVCLRDFSFVWRKYLVLL